MSALGQKQTRRGQTVMSALPPKADIRPRDQDVCFVPEGDSPVTGPTGFCKPQLCSQLKVCPNSWRAVSIPRTQHKVCQRLLIVWRLGAAPRSP